MKLNITVLAILLVISIGYGCKKEKDPVPEPGQSNKSTCRVKSVREDDFQPFRSLSYEYDANGRIIKSVKHDGSYSLYEYSTGQLSIKDYTKFDQPIKPNPELTIYLNAQGYISKIIKKYSQTVFDTAEYTYTSDGYLLAEKVYGGSASAVVDITSYTVVDNNITKMETVAVFPTKTDSGTVTFTFLPIENKAGICQRTLGDAWPLNRFIGRPNKNLINTQTTTVGSQTEIAQYHYDMKDGLPSYSYISYPSGSDYFKRKYEFQCD